jgi:hypothetical protein
MIRARQRLHAGATLAALGLALAGIFAGGAHAQTYTSHTPTRGHYPGSHIAPARAYPNHKPLRGNYPGSYASSRAAPSLRPSAGFDVLAAGIGAAGMLGLVLLLTAGRAGLRTARRSRVHDTPLFLEVRDDGPW